MLYLLHSTKALHRTPTINTAHYLGFSEEDKIWQRLKQHASNQSKAKIISAFHNLGAELHLVRVWPGATRDDERRVKNSGHQNLLCPICQHGNPRRIRSIPTDIPLLIPLSSLRHIVVPSSATLGSMLGGMLADNTGRSHLHHGVGNRILWPGTQRYPDPHPSGSRSSATATLPEKVGTWSATTRAPSTSRGSTNS